MFFTYFRASTIRPLLWALALGACSVSPRPTDVPGSYATRQGDHVDSLWLLGTGTWSRRYHATAADAGVQDSGVWRSDTSTPQAIVLEGFPIRLQDTPDTTDHPIPGLVRLWPQRTLWGGIRLLVSPDIGLHFTKYEPEHRLGRLPTESKQLDVTLVFTLPDTGGFIANGYPISRQDLARQISAVFERRVSPMRAILAWHNPRRQADIRFLDSLAHRAGGAAYDAKLSGWPDFLSAPVESP